LHTGVCSPRRWKQAPTDQAIAACAWLASWLPGAPGTWKLVKPVLVQARTACMFWLETNMDSEDMVALRSQKSERPFITVKARECALHR
jgi:hypothetical protein